MSDLAIMMKAKPAKEEPMEPMNEKPCMYVTDKDMPNIADMKVGDEVMIKVRVRAKSTSESDEGGEKKSVELELANGDKPEAENKVEDKAEEGVEE